MIGTGGAPAIDTATSICTKLQALLTQLNTKFTAVGGVAGVTYAAPATLSLAAVEAGLNVD